MSTTHQRMRHRLHPARIAALAAIATLVAIPVHVHAGKNTAGKNTISSLQHKTAVWADARKGAQAAARTAGTTTLRVRGTATPTFTVYKLERPARVVVDVANATIDRRVTGGGDDKVTWSVNSWSVAQVAAHAIRGTGRSVVRIVVGLARPGTYNVKADGNDVVVTVIPRDPAPRSMDANQARQAVAQAKASARRASAEAVQAKAAAEDATRRAQIEAARASKAEKRAEAMAVKARDRAQAVDASRAEIARAKKLASDSRAEAERARQIAARSKSDAERARKAAKDNDQAAQRARESAAQSAKDAERAREIASRATREAREASAAAQRSRSELERVRKSAVASKAEVQRAQRVAEAARAEASKAREVAEERTSAAEKARAMAARQSREAEAARRTAAATRAQAERARNEASARLAKAKEIERKAEASRAEIAHMKKQLASKNAQASEALRVASAQRAAIERDHKAAESARKEAEASRQAATRAKREAERMQAAAQADKRAAEKARERAEAEIARLTAEARKEAKKARQQAEEEAAALKAEAASAAKKAAKALATAHSETAKTKARAEERLRQADVRMAEAKAMITDASKRLRRAEGLERTAAKARKAADEAEARATAKQQSATRAQREAEERRVAADRAVVAAERYRKEAEQAGDTTRSRALRQRAAQASKEAEKRLVESESAAARARKAQKQAETAAAQADKRRLESVSELARAQEQREAAERARDQARSERERAVAQRRSAEERRAEAEQAAREADERASRSRKLRQREEVAYNQMVRARTQAVERASAARAAGVRLDTASEQVRAAEKRAAAMRKAATEAQARAARFEKQRTASKREIQQARTEARRLAKERTKAEAEVRSQRQQVARYRKKMNQLESARGKAQSELSRLAAAADKARTARESEEQALVQLAERRAEAERGLRAAEKARAAAEAEAAKARDRAAKATAQKTARAVRVHDIDFVNKDKVARVVIALSGQTQPRVVSSTDKRVVLELPSTALPSKLQRTLDTTRYRGPIKSVSSYRPARDKSKVRVVVHLARPTKHALKRKGDTLYWDFAKRKHPVTARKGQSPGRQNGQARGRPAARAISFPSPVVGSYGASSTPITQKTIAQLAGRQRKVYRGTKIDLDFKDADIHNLLRLLADVGGVNIVIPDEIQARVTVRLRRVPWDQALEVILASKGLWYRREGNLYRIAPRKTLDEEDAAEAERLANLARGEAPEPEIFTLNYAVARDLKTQIEPLLSPKGRIEVDTRTNALIINDIRSHRRRIIDLLTRLDTQTPQIQIEARIVEARSTFTREIGVQWGGSAAASAGTGNATGLLFPSNAVVRGGADDNNTNATGINAVPSDFAINLPAAVGSGSGGALGLALGSIGGAFNINLRLSALEDSGSVRIISAPKITVLNNVKAEISQGVSIPISVISANGVQTQFVRADLALKVTPHVSQRDCTIQMELEVTKNEADFANTGARGDPSILQKEAKTTILVADGETTVLGGIYTRNTGLNYSKVPFFGDLPVIGWLFKNRSENDERTEVLVFVTPKITNKAFLRCE